MTSAKRSKAKKLPAAKRSMIRPSEMAAEWGIDVGKVLAWIRSGELIAINATERRGVRPRYLIDRADIVVFKRNNHAVQPVVAAAPRRSRATQDDSVSYF